MPPFYGAGAEALLTAVTETCRAACFGPPPDYDRNRLQRVLQFPSCIRLENRSHLPGQPLAVALGVVTRPAELRGLPLEQGSFPTAPFLGALVRVGFRRGYERDMAAKIKLGAAAGCRPKDHVLQGSARNA